MTGRRFAGVLVAAAAALYSGTGVAAQDTQYNRAIERAQEQRPATLGATARIAPASEPGDALVVRGRVLGATGAAAAGAVIFAYQTDHRGIYDRPERGAHSWRLKGWAQAGADGRFTFETIRPGAYPNSNILPHIHFTVFLPNGDRYHAGELQLSMTRPAAAPVPEQATIGLRLEARQKF